MRGNGNNKLADRASAAQHPLKNHPVYNQTTTKIEDIGRMEGKQNMTDRQSARQESARKLNRECINLINQKSLWMND